MAVEKTQSKPEYQMIHLKNIGKGEIYIYE